MKRDLQAQRATRALAAAVTLLGLAATASAQSSVTLFGVVDVGVRYVKNDDLKIKSLSTNGANTSRLGLRGYEDLGDGFKAGFWLESGFTPDNGMQSDPSRFWNRRSTVSLLGAYGELRVGRDQTPTYLGFGDYDVFGTNGIATTDKFVSSLGTSLDTGNRADNLVSYFTPQGLSGFYSHVAVAAGEGVAGKKYVGARAGYAAGAYNLSAAYGQTTVAPVLGDDKFKTFDVGGSYDFGVVKMMGYYFQSKFVDLKLAVYNVGAMIPLGAGRVRLSYIHANASGTTPAGVDTNPNDANQFAVGYVYDLSKRTALYGTIARINNKGAANFAVATPPSLVPGKDSTGAEFGLRHSF